MSLYGNTLIGTGLSSQDSDCAICYAPISPIDATLTHHPKGCNHAFHSECLLKWLSVQDEADTDPSCPMCRGEIPGPKTLHGMISRLVRAERVLRVLGGIESAISPFASTAELEAHRERTSRQISEDFPNLGASERDVYICDARRRINELGLLNEPQSTDPDQRLFPRRRQHPFDVLEAEILLEAAFLHIFGNSFDAAQFRASRRTVIERMRCLDGPRLTTEEHVLAHVDQIQAANDDNRQTGSSDGHPQAHESATASSFSNPGTSNSANASAPWTSEADDEWEGLTLLQWLQSVYEDQEAQSLRETSEHATQLRALVQRHERVLQQLQDQLSQLTEAMQPERNQNRESQDLAERLIAQAPSEAPNNAPPLITQTIYAQQPRSNTTNQAGEEDATPPISPQDDILLELHDQLLGQQRALRQGLARGASYALELTRSSSNATREHWQSFQRESDALDQNIQMLLDEAREVFRYGLSAARYAQGQQQHADVGQDDDMSQDEEEVQQGTDENPFSSSAVEQFVAQYDTSMTY